LKSVADHILDRLSEWRHVSGAPLVLGICGPQGCGKSTVAAALQTGLAEQGASSAVLSLDDLYLSHAARARMAQDLHPLFATRGVPGTHDVALGLEVLAALKAGRAVHLPRFDKATDNPRPTSEWPCARQPCDVILFEGPACVWRTYVDDQLAGPYQLLFAEIDRLALLRAPDFDIVRHWRREQEHQLIAASAPNHPSAAMSDPEIDRFVQHYERITRHIAEDMPGRADLMIELDQSRQVFGTMFSDRG
jgi:D-glycerate 3-kinase